MNNWDETTAHTLASLDGLILNKDHWQVIYFLRDFYKTYNRIPSIKAIVNGLAIENSDKDSAYWQDLFPQGILQQATKFAGLPKPGRCL
jgi:tRNA 2-thiouridine synthesizing protein E